MYLIIAHFVEVFNKIVVSKLIIYTLCSFNYSLVRQMRVKSSSKQLPYHTVAQPRFCFYLYFFNTLKRLGRFDETDLLESDDVESKTHIAKYMSKLIFEHKTCIYSNNVIFAFVDTISTIVCKICL